MTSGMQQSMGARACDSQAEALDAARRRRPAADGVCGGRPSRRAAAALSDRIVQQLLHVRGRQPQ